MRSILLALVCLLISSVATANETDGLTEPASLASAGTTAEDLARKHFDEAVELFRTGQYRLARAEFQASFDVSKSADLLHNLSLTAERQYELASAAASADAKGFLDDAIVFEERFLAAKGSSITQREVDETQGRLVRLRSQAAAPVIQAQPSAGKKRYQPPKAGLALLGAGLGFLVVGIATGAVALKDQHALDAGGAFTSSDYQALLDRGRALNATAITFDVLGGGLAISGLVWVVVDRARHPQNERLASGSLSSNQLVW